MDVDRRGSLLLKSKGSGTMVADFIDKYNGYLHVALTPEEQAQNPIITTSARMK